MAQEKCTAERSREQIPSLHFSLVGRRTLSVLTGKNGNLGCIKEDIWLSTLAGTCPRKSVAPPWIPRSRIGSRTGPSLAHTNQYMSNAQRTIGLSTVTNRRSA